MSIIVESPPLLAADPRRLLPEIGVGIETPQPMKRTTHRTIRFRIHIPRPWSFRIRFHELSRRRRCFGESSIFIRTRGFIGISTKKSTDNGEENKNEIEGIPAFLHQMGFEYVGSEREQCGDYDEHTHTSSDKKEDEKNAGAKEERVRAAETAAPAASAVGLQPKWGVTYPSYPPFLVTRSDLELDPPCINLAYPPKETESMDEQTYYHTKTINHKLTVQNHPRIKKRIRPAAPNAPLQPLQGPRSSHSKPVPASNLPSIFSSKRIGVCENLIFYTGCGYFAGAVGGAAVGLVEGVKSFESGDTTKLRVNRVLNASGHSGRAWRRRLCGLGLLYAGIESGIEAARDTDDVWNSVAAGLGTGALYRAVRGVRSAAVAGAVGGVVVGVAVTAKQALKRYVPI
ncbi:mitochondrial import inner membrane translocase subunit TIM23-2-like [Senna tora]|uniref:Mitochondrial import inner membrane translocase subunit TIM23-2-like n=1 Tax=Senna tora TaxID=362788 RepID=A0A835CLM4_9FABA|nr:mitochondrial import inner membrane translocase subunit TIM23-2-like [Senna tora]